MIAQNYGKIINIGSFHCQVTMNGVPRSGYSTAKGRSFNDVQGTGCRVGKRITLPSMF